MKRTIRYFSLFLLTTCCTLPAFADCTPGTSWTAAWTDLLGQTTYSLQAPCKVYIGIPFDIAATVTDSFYPNGDVGYGWSIRDNGVTIAGGGFNWITLVNGQWQRGKTITYTGTPIDHLFRFYFTDLGAGNGAHWWGGSLTEGVTVDPYPPVTNVPPTADAGPSIFILSENQIGTTIQGTSADADGDALTYRWLEGATEVQSSRPVGVGGAAPLDLGALPPLSIGDHTFTLEVSDKTHKVTDTMVVSMENSAPVASAYAGGTVQVGENVSLKGTVADFDGDSLTYQWLEGTTVLNAGQIATVHGGGPVALPDTVIAGGLSLGTHVLTLQVSDGIHQVAATTTFTIIDTVAPTLAPSVSTSMLWPPNGAMTEVTIDTHARDNSSGPIFLNVLLTTNQPQQKVNGKIIPDWTIVKIDPEAKVIVLKLRNARSGKSGDRLYRITVTATDASGNASSADVVITAPHDKRRLDVTRGRSALAPGKVK